MSIQHTNAPEAIGLQATRLGAARGAGVWRRCWLLYAPPAAQQKWCWPPTTRPASRPLRRRWGGWSCSAPTLPCPSASCTAWQTTSPTPSPPLVTRSPPPPPSRGAAPLLPGGGRRRRRSRASEHTQKPLSVCAQLALTEQAFYASAPNRQITRNQHANGRPPRLLSLRAPTFV